MKYDVIVIGSGPGGYVAAVKASQYGFNTAVVERDELGGVCLNWGCIPTKALLKSAQALHYAGSGETFGFCASDVRPDLDAMVRRSREVSARMCKGIGYLFGKNNITLIRGTGKVAAAHKVEVTGPDSSVSLFEADHIILATGSSPACLPFLPIDGEKVICYRQALVPERLPESIAVIGSGAIGTELAFFYRTIGVSVTLIEYLDRILPLEDDDVSTQVSRSLRKEGVKLMTSSCVRAVDTSGDHCVLTVETNRGTETVEASKVLSAVGVRPNTVNLGLEDLGVVTVSGKVPVDKYFRTSVEGLYAIGDIIDTPALAHVASAEAECCVAAFAGREPSPVNYDNIPACTYITPEVASVGMTERRARDLGIGCRIGKFPFSANGRAVAAGARDGFVKLIVNADDDSILGAHLVGDNASEMIGCIVLARNAGVTASQLQKSIFPHPTMSEALAEAAAASQNESVHN